MIGNIQCSAIIFTDLSVLNQSNLYNEIFKDLGLYLIVLRERTINEPSYTCLP